MKRAAFEAYAEHLEPFHNWLLKNTFTVAFNGMPSRVEVFNRYAPNVPKARKQEVVAKELRECLVAQSKVLDSLLALFHELDLEDTRKV